MALFGSPLESLFAPIIFCSLDIAPNGENDDEILPRSLYSKDGFKACLDVQHFTSKELTVRTEDNSIIIEGDQDEDEDDGEFISRHFVRRYELPENYDMSKVKSTLSADNILTITAPAPTNFKLRERHVPVEVLKSPREILKQNFKNSKCNCNCKCSARNGEIVKPH